jgi:hypothetical protein
VTGAGVGVTGTGVSVAAIGGPIDTLQDMCSCQETSAGGGGTGVSKKRMTVRAGVLTENCLGVTWDEDKTNNLIIACEIF